MLRKKKLFLDLSKQQQNRRILQYGKNIEKRNHLYEKFIRPVHHSLDINDSQQSNTHENFEEMEISFQIVAHHNDEENDAENEFIHLVDNNIDNTNNLEEPNLDFNNVNNDNVEFNIEDFFREWKKKFNIPNNALSSLLKGLRKAGFNILPKDSRNFLRTPRFVNTSNIACGAYVHYGLEQALKEQLERVRGFELPEMIFINLSIDGLPLSLSSSSEVWPILATIADFRFKKPFLIWAWHGSGKPASAEEFMKPFHEEYVKLNNEGFSYLNKRYFVKINIIIADTVARNYIGQFPAHNSRCWKCIQPGKTIQHCRLFLEMDSPLRTNENFRYNLPVKFSNITSPLEKIGINMIDQVVLDPMHLVDLGVLKKLLMIFKNQYAAPKGQKVNPQIQALNKVHFDLREWFPVEINRKP